MFRMSLKTRAAAFTEYGDPAPEIARLLREAADRIEQGETEGALLDINGNTAGRFNTKSR